jgi:branched-chain amino acid transport system substrate-binding protein
MNFRTSALAFAALVAIGCAPAHAQLSDGILKIGILNDQSGTSSNMGGQGSVVAARMAVEDFGGIVLGKPIQVIFADHQNKPDIASTIATRWIQNEQVDALVDVPFSSVALGIQNIAKANNRMILISGAGSTDLTGKNCKDISFTWTWSTYSYANGVVNAIPGNPGSWFFISVDSSGMLKTVEEASDIVKAKGGKVIGLVKHPINPGDFSSLILQAQASKADVIALANTSSDFINTMKAAKEYGVTGGKQKIVGLLTFIPQVHAMGLTDLQGMLNTVSFYWDLNDESRAWTKRFRERFNGQFPSEPQAGVYSAVMHYLKGVKAAGTDEAQAVAREMRKMPVKDFMTNNATIRADGQVARDMYLMQVKAPSESKYAYDYYKLVRTIPGAQAFKPLSESECPLVTKK